MSGDISPAHAYNMMMISVCRWPEASCYVLSFELLIRWCTVVYYVQISHAYLPAFGRILPLFRRILAIPCGMHEILLVAELPKIQVSSSKNVPKRALSPLGELTMPPQTLSSWLGSGHPLLIPFSLCTPNLAPWTNSSFSFF